MLNRGEIRTRDLGVTSPHALPSELHGQPDFKTVNIYTVGHIVIHCYTLLYEAYRYSISLCRRASREENYFCRVLLHREHVGRHNDKGTIESSF